MDNSKKRTLKNQEALGTFLDAHDHPQGRTATTGSPRLHGAASRVEAARTADALEADWATPQHHVCARHRRARHLRVLPSHHQRLVQGARVPDGRQRCCQLPRRRHRRPAVLLAIDDMGAGGAAGWRADTPARYHHHLAQRGRGGASAARSFGCTLVVCDDYTAGPAALELHFNIFLSNGFWFPTLKFFYSPHEFFRRIFRWVVESDISNAKSNGFLNIQNLT